jgi:hypothetical protein
VQTVIAGNVQGAKWPGGNVQEQRFLKSLALMDLQFIQEANNVVVSVLKGFNSSKNTKTTRSGGSLFKFLFHFLA